MNFVASLPATARALVSGRLHSRVPATMLIAIGAFIPLVTDSLNRLGSTEFFQLGKFLGVVFLFAGFLVSVETFREIRIPFTAIRLAPAPARARDRADGGGRRPRGPARARLTPRAAADRRIAPGAGAIMMVGNLCWRERT